MMDRSTALLCGRLRTARKPEDVFGPIAEGPLSERLLAVKHVFNNFVVLLHPDRNPDVTDAGQHVARLKDLRAAAEKLLKDGTYGKPRRATLTAVLRSRAGTYKVLEEFRVGDIADLFIGETDETRCLLKVVRQPRDNDLLDIEARTLAALHGETGEKATVFQKYLPKLLDSFALIESGGRQRKVNVLNVADGYYSLAEVREAYPDGLDTRDAAWMIRRAFEVLSWIHDLGYVHGAVLPEHVLVHPQKHGARLVGWSYAVRTGMRLTAISASRKDMYPASVLRREPATPALDIQLAGQCALLLLSDRVGKLRADVPKDVVTFFEHCCKGKTENGAEAYCTYDELLKKNFGKRTYRAFAMPSR